MTKDVLGRSTSCKCFNYYMEREYVPLDIRATDVLGRSTLCKPPLPALVGNNRAHVGGLDVS